MTYITERVEDINRKLVNHMLVNPVGTHSAVTVTDTTTVNLTLTGQDIKADFVLTADLDVGNYKITAEALNATVANTLNLVALTVSQNDTTNNPVACNFTNAGTNDGFHLQQTGVLAANKFGIKLYSNAVQVNSYLAAIHQDNASSTAGLLYILNDGTGYALYIDHNGATGNAIYIDSEYVGVESYGKYALYGKQDVSGGYGLYITRNIAEAGSAALVQFIEDHASGTQACVSVQQDGTGAGIFVDKNAAGNGINIDFDDNSATASVGLYMNIANAGAGLEYAFSFNGSETVASAVGGTANRKIRVSIGGVDGYISVNTS